MQLTKTQRWAGFDITPLLQGAVGFTELRTIHLSLVKEELKARNINFPTTGKGIKAFVGALKAHINLENDGDKPITHFKPIAAGYYAYFPDDAEGGDESQAAGGSNEDSTGNASSNVGTGGFNHVLISKLRKGKHMKLLFSELMGCGVTIPLEKSHKVNALKKLLMDHEQNLKRLDTKPSTFEPMYTALAEYNT